MYIYMYPLSFMRSLQKGDGVFSGARSGDSPFRVLKAGALFGRSDFGGGAERRLPCAQLRWMLRLLGEGCRLETSNVW